MKPALKQLLITVVGGFIVSVAVTLYWPPAGVNPDANHAHADFAVWINGKQLDFSAPEFMSGSSTDETTHPDEGMRKYLHLHDGNGHVIHRHKPGLSFDDFILSIGFAVASEKPGEFCWYAIKDDRPFDVCQSAAMHLFVNGKDLGYTLNSGAPTAFIFNDEDQLLLTDATDSSEIQKQLAQLTDDACKYSKTCPWRGSPPTEGCIADPTVPCRE